MVNPKISAAAASDTINHRVEKAEGLSVASFASVPLSTKTCHFRASGWIDIYNPINHRTGSNTEGE